MEGRWQDRAGGAGRRGHQHRPRGTRGLREGAGLHGDGMVFPHRGGKQGAGEHRRAHGQGGGSAGLGPIYREERNRRTSREQVAGQRTESGDHRWRGQARPMAACGGDLQWLGQGGRSADSCERSPAETEGGNRQAEREHPHEGALHGWPARRWWRGFHRGGAGCAALLVRALCEAFARARRTARPADDPQKAGCGTHAGREAATARPPFDRRSPAQRIGGEDRGAGAGKGGHPKAQPGDAHPDGKAELTADGPAARAWTVRSAAG